MENLKAIIAEAVATARKEGSVGLVVGPGSNAKLMRDIIRDLTGDDIVVRECGSASTEGSSVQSRESELVLLLRAEHRTELSKVFDISSDERLALELFARGGQLVHGNAKAVSKLSQEFAPALGILVDLEGLVQQEHDDALALQRLILAARTTTTFQNALRDALVYGNRLFDVARIMVLIGPEPIDLSDEWADLASAISGGPITTSLLTQFLVTAPEYFVVEGLTSQFTVRFRTSFARSVLSGMVPPSQSEHLAIYRRLRKRASESLSYEGDSSDAFVRRQLPTQAIRGGALGELLADPAAVLSSDVLALAKEVERSPSTVRSLHARIFLEAAHQLLRGDQRASHLELSALRCGDLSYSEDINRLLDGSSWRSVWNKSEPVNVSRVVTVRHSPVLAVSGVRGDDSGRFVAACSNESLWKGRLRRSVDHV